MKTAIAPLFITALLLATACQPAAPPATEADTEATTEAAPVVEAYTLAQFEAIETGMTLEEVEADLGPGELVSSMAIEGMEDSTVYQWANADGSNITLSFTGDALTSTAQFGLK